MLGYSILCVLVGCAIYIQFRGKVRHNNRSHFFNDHSNFVAPINCLFYIFSKVENKPYIDLNSFPELNVIQKNWDTIRDEALHLKSNNRITSSSINDDFVYHSFYKRGWKKFALKWYGSTFLSAKRLCPKTVSLIESVPSIKAAMFTILPSGRKLMNHRDPFAGSLRYQLGLDTPNSEDCHIYVDGEKYYWQDGEAVIFDETFIHYVENNTKKDRLILLLDIRRPVNLFLIDWINILFSSIVMRPASPKNTEDDKVGFLNRVLAFLYPVRSLGKRLKSFNEPIYFISQYGIYLYLIYILFL